MKCQILVEQHAALKHAEQAAIGIAHRRRAMHHQAAILHLALIGWALAVAISGVNALSASTGSIWRNCAAVKISVSVRATPASAALP
jgi:hypothetical protein